MTATIDRPRVGPAGEPPPYRPAEPRHSGWDPTTSAAAELAVVGLTVAAVLGLGRLFVDASFLPEVLAVVLAAHAVAWGSRRLGLGPVAAVAVSALGLLLAIGWVIEPATTTFGLPLERTWAAIGADLRAAWEAFGEVRAPTPVTRGFLLAAAIGGWVAAFAADTFAFRARARIEAVVPSFVLFLFGALIGADRHRLATTALYLVAVLLFVVLTDASRRTGWSWFAGRSADGERALARGGLAMALVAACAAVVVGPRLPGARSDGLVNWLDGPNRRSSSPRITVSPLVDIKSRLVDRSNTEVFTVRASDPTYWRLTSLERFDGSIWSSSGSFQPARRRLPAGVRTRAPARSVVQHFEIKALAAIWLPAAYRPQAFDGPRGVRFDPDSSSLLTDAESSDGLRYSVESAIPDLAAAELTATPPGAPESLKLRYLDLPADFPESVTRQARQVTAGLSPFHAARALQDWFRTNFTYSLNVRPGHGEEAILRFLRERRGYCEQFAGTYAAMARAIGLPSRVAVGFTPGTPNGDALRVTAREAHAWPEVYLAGFGWVAFEPTPGRAIPGGEDYTGVEGPTAAAEAAAADESPGPTAAPPTTVSPAPAPSTPEEQEDPTQARQGADEGSGSSLPDPWVTASVLAALAYLGGVPLARLVVRRRRRAAAATPTDRVLAAWQDAEEDLSVAGLGRHPAETGSEYARRLANVGGPASSGRVAAGMAELAGHRSAAAFSPTGVDEGTAAQAERAAAAVTTALRSEAGPARRTLWALNPRPLMDAAKESVGARWRGRAATPA
jgi:transglutaminase-like putative cysteine protease